MRSYTKLLYLSAEYPWEAAAGLELAVFYDTSKVFPDSSDFDLDDRNESYGFGREAQSKRLPESRALGAPKPRCGRVL